MVIGVMVIGIVMIVAVVIAVVVLGKNDARGKHGGYGGECYNSAESVHEITSSHFEMLPWRMTFGIDVKIECKKPQLPKSIHKCTFRE